MSEREGEGVPPHMPPPFAMPPPARNFVPPPPTSMPPPVPGTGASGQWAGHAPTQMHMVPPHSYGPLRPDKSLGLSYLLWFFLGFLGVHHFYLGKVGRGIGYLLTFGWFMVGLVVDLFTLPSQVRRLNYERRAGFR